MFKKKYLVKSIIFSFVLLSAIIFSCDKKKIIQDDLNICIESFSLLNSENTDKKLGSDITCDIDIDNHTISLKVPNGAILEGLKFSIKTCEGSSISPASGQEVNFEVVEESATDEVSEESAKKPSTQRYKKTFIVTAKDGKTQEYTVYITKEAAPKLTEFKISADAAKGIKTEISAVITDDTDTATGKILLKIPYKGAITLTGLTPVINVPEGCTIDPADGSEISEDINVKEFTLTKTDTGSQRVYTVEVVKGPYIESFKFAATSSSGSSTNAGISTEVTGVIDHIVGTISVIVPNGVTLSSLTPTITVGENTKAEYIPSAQTNFSSNVEYTVTSSNPSAADFTKVYTVSVTQNAEPAISEFKFLNSNNGSKNLVGDITGEINGSDIIVKVPYNAELNGLTPTITASSALADTQVYSGDAGQAAIAATDFSNSHAAAVKYSAVGPAGGRKVYSVKVYKEPKINTFKFTSSVNSSAGFPTSPTEYDGSISGDDITILVANTVKVTNLKASITGDNINTTNPINITFTSTSDTSPYSATIEVQNEHLSSYTKTYTVTLTKEAAPKLTEFKISADTTKGIQSEVTGDITDDDSNSASTGTIKLKFDHKVSNRNTDIDLTGLTYTNEPIAGCTLTPGTPLASNSIAGQTFILTKDATGSKRVYAVTAVKGPFIKSFKFGTGNTGISSDISAASIDHNTGAITITVPATVNKDLSSGTDNKVSLTPTIELGGDTPTIVSPNTGVSTEFTSGTAVSYTVTGADGMTKTYQVTVTRTKSNLAQITKFTIDSTNGDITHPDTGNGDKGRIVVPVANPPTGTKTPTIEKSDYATVSPSTAQNFTYENPVTYTLTAEDTSTQKIYEVYIHDSTKTIASSDSLKLANSSSAEITPTSKDINETTRVITITVPASTTNLNNLTLTLTGASSGLSIEPTDPQDFSGEKEVKYILKESSDVKGHYWVKVVKGTN
ncbi:DUF5018 domain-containing protein [Ichthyobacterium seriolicida]|uniref:Pkd domain containing protein n=1 Tax=Ichthyobacterium seriolicida TaxID=242600 RepID=A0A1J1E3X5_9FLAO|nr:hypothetical protein [Ichthyobacterium seriolicida]BAV94748.1 pkd domain containing protein [Ichthyobacterium seriolicida]